MLSAELAKQGIQEAEDVADVLVSAGIYELQEAGWNSLAGPNHAEVLPQVRNISSLIRNASNIKIAAERASKIVFAPKNYAHPGAANEVSNRSLAEGLNTILTLYQNQIKRGVEVITDFDEKLDVTGQHERLNQVWTNLIHNALQAMEYQGTLELLARKNTQAVEVSICDSGPGIPNEILDKIFNPFFTTKALGEGTGLGLVICHDIVEQHQGQIRVQSAPGRTCFTVVLPPDDPALS